MKWKDVFFFNKKDKTAILILTCTGIILSGSYLAYPHIRNTSENDTTLEEFSAFQKDLRPIYASNSAPEKQSTSITSSSSKKKLVAGQQIDLNSANEVVLKKVPGIGDTFAKRIAEFRGKLGGFAHIDQLLEVKGISEKKFEKIKPFFILEKQPQKRPLDKLIQLDHPYLNEKQIASISGYINAGNKITSLETLQALEHFSPRDTDRIKDYVHFK